MSPLPVKMTKLACSSFIIRDLPNSLTPEGRSVMSEARVFERSNVPLTLSMKTIGPPSMTSATSRLSISCLSFPGVKGFGRTAYAMALMARANKPLPEPAPLICGAFRRRPGANDRLCRQTAVNRPFRKPLSSIPIGALKSTNLNIQISVKSAF